MDLIDLWLIAAGGFAFIVVLTGFIKEERKKQ